MRTAATASVINWALTLGLRYSEDRKSGRESLLVVVDPTIYGVDPAQAFPADDCCGWLTADPQQARRQLSDEWSTLTGRAVLDYRFSDTAMVYASLATGYKPGGFSLGPLQADPGFEPEEVLSLELGYKGSFADTLRLNAAAYYYDYRDMQVLVSELTDAGTLSPQVRNADRAEVRGLELEVSWAVTDAFNLLANYSHIDGEYTDFCCAVDSIGAPERGRAGPLRQPARSGAAEQAVSQRQLHNGHRAQRRVAALRQLCMDR